MKRPYQITALLFVLFSIFVAQESLKLELYSQMGPGPGFFPFWLAVVFGLISLVMLLQACRQANEPLPAGFFPSKVGYTRNGAVLLALVATSLLIEPLGFRLTILGFLLFLLFALGRQNLLVTLLVALLGSFGTYYVFYEWLRVPLPVGILGI